MLAGSELILEVVPGKGVAKPSVEVRGTPGQVVLTSSFRLVLETYNQPDANADKAAVFLGVYHNTLGTCKPQ